MQRHSFLLKRMQQWRMYVIMLLGVCLPFISQAQEKPNLLLSKVTLENTRLATDDILKMNFSIVNAGGGNAYESRLGIYLSKDKEFNSWQDVQLSYKYINQLEPGERKSYEQFKINLDNYNLEAGRWNVLVIADVEQELDETFEGDNMADPIAIVLEEGSSDVEADLYLKKIDMENTVFKPGYWVNASYLAVNLSAYDVNNIGLNIELSKTNKYGHSSSQNLQNTYLGSISAGNIRDSNLSFHLPDIEEGDSNFRLRFLLNSANDPNSSNNVIEMPISIIDEEDMYDKADLSIRSFLDEGSMYDGHTFRVEIHNEGYAYVNNATLQVDLSPTPNWEDRFGNSNTFTYYHIYSGNYKSLNVYNDNYDDLEPGQYFMLLKTSTSTEESNEENNFQAIPVIIPKIEKGDLTIKKATVNQTIAKQGDYINLDVSLLNQGDKYFYSSLLHAYFMPASQYTDNWNETYYHNRITRYYLYPNEVDRFNWNLSVPSLSPGKYYLVLKIDGNNAIKESVENNNVYAIEITIKEDENAPANLIVKNLAVNTNAVRPGESIDVESTVYNVSENASEHSAALKYYIGDSPEQRSGLTELNQSYTISSMPGNYSRNIYRNLVIPASYEAGSKYLIVHVDAYNQVNETNEEDNWGAIPIALAHSKIDLVPEVNYFTDFMPQGGYTMELQGRITNNGETSSSKSNISYFLSKDEKYDNSDQYLAQYNSYDIINSGSSYYANGYPYLYLNSGSYYLLAVVDRYNKIKETNEDNNVVVAGRVRVVDRIPDLTPQTPNISRSKVALGEYDISVSLQIENQGFSYAYSNFSLFISKNNTLDDDAIKVKNKSSFNAHSNDVTNISTYIDIPYDIEKGNYYLIVQVDEDDQTEEFDDDNNISVSSMTFEVADPDIDLNGSVNVDETSAIAGQTLFIDYEVKNIGTTSSSSSSLLRMVLSDDKTIDPYDNSITANYANGLNPGASHYYNYYYQIPQNISNGKKYILLDVDHYNYVEETDESNNIVLDSVTITDPDVDFSIEYANLNTSAYLPGTPLNLDFELTNNGSTKSPNSFTYRVYLSQDNLSDGSDILLSADYVDKNAISAYDFKEISKTYYLTNGYFSNGAGTYYLIVKADDYGQVSETDENNNLDAIAFEVLEEVKMANTNSTVCDAYFTDPGGVSNNYSNFSNYTHTLSPSSPTSILSVNFESFNLSPGDYLEVYYGNTTDPAKYIGSYSGNNIGSFQSSTMGEALTFRLVANASGTSAGWIARTECIVIPPRIANTHKEQQLEASVEEQLSKASNRMKLYPNPAMEELTVEISDDFVGAQFELINAHGKVLRKANVPSASFAVQLSHLPAGVYFIKIGNNTQSKLMRFLKK